MSGRFARLSYAFGAFGFNVLFQTVTLWLIYFYAPPAETGRPALVPLALVGILLGVGRLIEAFDDPAIGHWTDVTRSARWGRRLPFMAAGLPALLVAFIALWLAGDWGLPWTAIYLFVVLQFYYLAYTVVHQPYEAVLAEAARAPQERVALSAWKVAFGTLGAAVALVASGLLASAIGFPGMAAAFAGIAGIALVVAAVGTAFLPRAPEHSRQLSLWSGLRLTATNRQFLIFVVSEVLFYLGLAMLTALLPYFVTVILGQDEAWVSLFTALYIGVAMASLPIVGWLAGRRGKAFVYRLAMAILAVMLPGLFFIGTLPVIEPMVQGLVYIALMGLPMSALFVLPNPIIGDIVDEDELRTGLRREGVYFGVEETIGKLGFALSTLVFGVVLETFGYTPAEPLGIRLIGPIAGACVLVGFVVFTLGYRLPDAVSPAAAERPAT